MSRETCPIATPDCKYASLGGCFADVHHEYYPRRAYRTELEKRFREHVLNKEVICRREHDEKHATEPIPVKPSVDEMREFLRDPQGEVA